MTDQNEPEVSKSAELLKEGRRHFICREYPKAVEKLSIACELLAEEHGDGNVVLADSFYSYGEALLEMARMEGPVLGNALKGAEVIDEAENPEKETEKDEKIEDESLSEEAKEEISNKVIDALCEAPVVNEVGDESKTEEKMETDDKEEAAKKDPESKETEAEAEKSEEVDVDEKKEAAAEDSDSKKDSKDGDSEDGDKEDEEGEGEEGDEEQGEDEGEEGDEAVGEDEEKPEEEEVGNLQLAWEIMEVARTLYEKRALQETEASEKSRLRVADCHKKLAEVMLERDEWQKASEEFQKCLDIELSILKTPNRRVAETHFEMGMAFDHARSFDESAEEFQKCISCLKEFQEVIKQKAEKTEDDEKEIQELDDLVKDVRGRLMEVKEQKKMAILKAAENGAGSSSNGFGSSNGTLNGTSNGFGESSKTNGHSETKSASSSGSGEKSTQDITHLVRKRPKDSEPAGSPLKKVRLDADGSPEKNAVSVGDEKEKS